MATWAKQPGQTLDQAKAQSQKSTAFNYRPGQAQPAQSPFSTSTPYQKNPAGDFAAYSPNTTVTQTSKQGSSPFSQAPQMPTSQTDGNWANYATSQRPSPFQATYGSPMGGQYDQPNFAQRDAFIQQINNQMTPYMTGQATGAPQFNFNQAWSQAGQMVNDGWQNPFTAVSQQSFPAQYQTQQPSASRAAPPNNTPPARPAPPPPTPGVRRSPELEAGGGKSWTPAPGYGFDKEGNQVPVREGGIYKTPYGATPYEGQSPYEREIELMKAQGRYGPARKLSANEQALADALNRSPSVQSDLARAREAMQNRTPVSRANTPGYGIPRNTSMVAGMPVSVPSGSNWKPGRWQPIGQNPVLDAMQARQPASEQDKFLASKGLRFSGGRMEYTPPGMARRFFV